MATTVKLPNKWEKSTPALMEVFAKALPVELSVERRMMFGYPCAFVNGNMFCGLHQQDIIVRLGAEEVLRRIAAGEGTAFSPSAGRTMKDYLSLSQTDKADASRIRRWLVLALNHAKTLPGKAPKRL